MNKLKILQKIDDYTIEHTNNVEYARAVGLLIDAAADLAKSLWKLAESGETPVNVGDSVAEKAEVLYEFLAWQVNRHRDVTSQLKIPQFFADMVSELRRDVVEGA